MMCEQYLGFDFIEVENVQEGIINEIDNIVKKVLKDKRRDYALKESVHQFYKYLDNVNKWYVR
jgi:phosphopantetheinyl transferase (holo-ACP synthase)